MSATFLGRPLGLFVGLHAVGTFIHFLHNAIFLPDYPGVPADWIPTGLLLSWLPIGALGLAGYSLHRSRERAGRVLLAVFGISGYVGLLHYTLAPLAEHSAMMHAMIALEVATATLLLVKLAQGFRRSQAASC